MANTMCDYLVESPEDAVLQKDLEELAVSGFFFGELDGCTVLVTGATGLIGSQVVKALACANRENDMKIHIVPMYRSEEKARRVLKNVIDRSYVTALPCDILDDINYLGDIDYIIHCASATSSRYFVQNPVETIDTAVYGTKNLLDFAAQKKVKGMVYLSSLEVYGVPQKGKEKVTEMDYGYIDPLKVRSSYSEGKRMVECLCAAYCSEYEVPVKIVRLSQTFGPGVEYDDGRVFAEFARNVIEKKNIVLHTQGGTVRSYLYTKDAVSAILQVLMRGRPGEAYNASNAGTVISIRDMAQLVCDTFPEAGINVEFDCPEDVSAFGYNPEMKIALDPSKLEALGWKSTVGLQDMFRRLVSSMEKKCPEKDAE